MNDEYTKLLYVLAGAAVIGFVGWVTVSIIDLKIKTSSIQEVRNDLKHLTGVVYEIAGKLGIPLRGS
jgi:hypothetical protein